MEQHSNSKGISVPESSSHSSVADLSLPALTTQRIESQRMQNNCSGTPPYLMTADTAHLQALSAAHNSHFHSGSAQLHHPLCPPREGNVLTVTEENHNSWNMELVLLHSTEFSNSAL